MMCKHDRFDILFYDGYILIRKCKDCGDVEMRVDGWSKPRVVEAAIKKAFGEDEAQ